MLIIKKAFLVIAAVLIGANGAFALDANDVAQLIRNGVEEEVIINMVGNQKLDRPLTANDVLALNSAGASGALLEYMTRPEAASAAYAAPSSPMIVGSPQIQVESPPTVITSPQTVVTTQPNVVYGSACPTPTYVYPYSSPYYVYSAPRYYRDRRPSYSFSFSWGSGWGRHHPHHGGYRGGPRGGWRGHRR